MDTFVRKPAVKVIAFILSVLSLIGAFFGIAAIALGTGSFMYTESDGSYRISALVDVYDLYQTEINNIFWSGNYEYLAENYSPDETNLRICLQEISGSDIISTQYNYDPAEETPVSTDVQYYTLILAPDGSVESYEFGYSRGIIEEWQGKETRQLKEHGYGDSESTVSDDLSDWSVRYFILTIGLAKDPQVKDVYTQLLSFGKLLYQWRYQLVWLCTGSLLLALGAHILLFAGAGRKTGVQEAVGGWQEKIPLDLYLILSGTVIGVGIGVLCELFYGFEHRFSYYDFMAMAVLAATAVTAVFIEGLLYTLVVRFKLGHWWKNTLCWRFGSWCLRLLKKPCKKIYMVIRQLYTALPLVWRGAALIGLALIGEAVVSIIMMINESSGGVLLWVLYNLFAVFMAIYLLAQMKRLAHAGEKLAAGDLDYRLQTEGMMPVFREHGENLNAISAGMSRAVDQRMRSERMKTELITNVSHDIKTPLTSIVNYVDLLSREQPENEQSREYIAALQRQSARLRKLIEDLVEASKASTGNLSVDLQPCEMGVLLEQTAGEYAERLTAVALSLVVRAPEEPVVVLADSRHIWRVLDNLMGNICKYALPGTRVYLTLEKKAGEAVLTLRNISREELNISEEELMERFVRGDSSRSTEGSGLGLSIARSLLELQHGKLNLRVDGDLFKVILTLPLLDEKREPQPPQETETLPEEAPPAETQDAEKAKKADSARRGHRAGFGKNPARWLYRKLQYIVEDEEK